jgi:hypothetical protein
VSAQAKRVTYGKRRCLSASSARSFKIMANWHIGREKQDGISVT